MRLTPVIHHVFNELDSQGLLYGLSRIEGESNASYKQRLLDIFAHRADSTYLGVIHAMTRELGLSIDTEFVFTFTKDSSGAPVLTAPAIDIDESVVTLYSDYPNSTIAAQFDTWETSSSTYTIGKLATEINKVSGFSVTLKANVNTERRAACLYNQSSVVTVTTEDLSEKGPVAKLDNDYILAKSVHVSSLNLFNRVYSQAAVVRNGDYYVDTQNGIIYSKSGAGPGTTVWYKYLSDDFKVKSSPVILHNLQSDTFKSRMFRQQLGNDGNYHDGMPTALGADLVNELFSVFGVGYGE